jgi:hypothetical protein
MTRSGFVVQAAGATVNRRIVALARAVSPRLASAARGRRRGSAPTAVNRIISPFPVFSANPETLLASGTLSRAARRRGWRALLVGADEALGIIDVGTKARGGRSVRGAEPARAFMSALEHCGELAERGEIDPRRCQIRVLEIPQIFVTAIWLARRPVVLVPTRVGATERPPPELWPFDRLLALVRRLAPPRRRRVPAKRQRRAARGRV